MNKLVIFDAYAIIYRAFHAMPPLTAKDGQPISAIYGLVSMLITVVDLLKPTHIIFCFDEKEKTFRNDLLPTYQAQRVAAPDDLIPQFSMARELLETMKIPVYSKSGFEADDIIGTIATRCAELKILNLKLKIDEVIVVTGDRDILQLVDDTKNIKLFMPIGGLSNGKIFAEKETVERMGVLPNQIADYKALVGDPSDNYFGIAGIGPKTASSLLASYKTLDGIYEHISDISEKLKTKLLEGKDSAYLSYKLATIVRDVPFKFDIDDANKWDLISENVLKLFEEYGFKTLTARIKKLGEQIEKEKQGSLF